MRTSEAYLVFLELELDETGSVSRVVDGFCHCPAGVNFDCQHVGATLWTMNDVAVQSGRLLGDYGEVSCTSRLRAWGVATGNLKSDVRIPMDQWVFRKHVPKKKKTAAEKEQGAAAREQARVRVRTVASMYEKAKASCTLKHVDEARLGAAADSLQVINRAYVTKSGSGHGVDLRLYNSINWKKLGKKDYPFAADYVVVQPPRRTSPRKRPGAELQAPAAKR